MWRTFGNIMILIGLFVFPWWLSAAIVVVFFLAFPRYYEIILWGVILDALHAPSIDAWWAAAIFVLGAYILVSVRHLTLSQLRWR